jgi:hypothetical protein
MDKRTYVVVQSEMFLQTLMYFDLLSEQRIPYGAKEEIGMRHL